MKRLSKKGRMGAKALRRYRRKKERIDMCLDRPEIVVLMLCGCFVLGRLSASFITPFLLPAVISAAAVWLCIAWVMGYGPGMPKCLKKLWKRISHKKD